MALAFQNRVLALLHAVLGGRLDTDRRATPPWLLRPGRAECRDQWDFVAGVYADLTGLSLPETMRPVERRQVDAVLVVGATARIVEVDEVQHFNLFRAQTLAQYRPDHGVAFDVEAWAARSRAKTRLEGGGFAKPMPPLFPGADGRHRQRAFRDMLCDIVPPLHGYAPTLRIGDFETKDWIWRADAADRMARLLDARLADG